MKKNMTETEARNNGYIRTTKYNDSLCLTFEGDEYIAKCGGTCESCPFEQLCEDVELWWGCYVWEEEMGDDL